MSGELTAQKDFPRPMTKCQQNNESVNAVNNQLYTSPSTSEINAFFGFIIDIDAVPCDPAASLQDWRECEIHSEASRHRPTARDPRYKHSARKSAELATTRRRRDHDRRWPVQ